MTPEEIRRYHAKWNRDNPEKRRMHEHTQREKKRDRYRLKNWKTRGLPIPTRPCPDLCEACGKPESMVHPKHGVVFGLSLDYCHITNRFRGWLCAKCNLTAGKFNDDYEAIRKLADYLETRSNRN